FAPQRHAAPQEAACGPHRCRIDRGLREQALTEEDSHLLRVNFIVFGLAAMHRFHVKRMAQHKSNPLTGAEGGEPVPGKDKRDSHDEIIPIGGNSLEKRLWTRWHGAMQQALAVLVKNTDVHGTGM